MLNFKAFFKNHFDSAEISDDELKKFSEDHLARITANDAGGQLTEIIATTGALHIAFFGAISNEDVAAAVRQGMTIRVDNSIAAFKKLVQQKEGAIRSAFGEDSAEYQEFFPQGPGEYSRATKENIEVLMERMVAATQAHEKALEPQLAETFQVARNEYKPLRETQLGKKGDVDDKKSKTSGNRTALELQLMANIHFIGYTFRNEVQKCLSYFDQSILRDPVKSGEHGEDDEQPGV